MTIYKSIDGKAKIMELYDIQLDRLKCPYSDKWVSTSFGRTHLIETIYAIVSSVMIERHKK